MVLVSLRAALAFLALVSLPSSSYGAQSKHTNSSKQARSHHGNHTPSLIALNKNAVVKHGKASGLAGAGKTGAAASDQEGDITTIEVNGPLPSDFTERFIQAAAKAANIPTSSVHVISLQPYAGSDGPPSLYEITFSAPEAAANSIVDQAADPDSDLANGALHWFLLERDEGTEEAAEGEVSVVFKPDEPTKATGEGEVSVVFNPHEPTKATAGGEGLDVDTELPFDKLESFGREDTAKELTEQSVDESNEMVDQFERAEVAEEKRAVFRALTRLRGAAITSFDGIARSQTGNIDRYSANNKWRATHPVKHLAQQEGDVSTWAFPSGSA